MVREHHVRFLKEARTGAGLLMTAGVLDVRDSEATVLQLLLHASGEPAAAVIARVAHVTPRDLRPFPWAASARQRLADLTVAAPDFAGPRSLSFEPVTTMASFARAEALGLPVSASGAVMPQDCDVFGRMLPAHLLARIYSTVGHSLRPSFLAALAREPGLEGRLGGAAVEFRAVYHAWPTAGDRLQLRSGHSALTAKARRLTHWMLDPATGRPWATAELVSLFLDLKARKALTLSPDTLEAMAVEPIEGLGL
jgi:acyl-CoA thioester hydrolase